MWKLKILSGTDKDKIFDLKPGSYVLGRAEECDVTLVSSGISKKHARLTVSPVGCFIQDLGSRNGIFINGIKVPEKQLVQGEKIMLNDTILELEGDEKNLSLSSFPPSAGVSYDGNLAYNTFPEGEFDLEKPNLSQAPKERLSERFDNYIENIVLHGIYKIPEVFDLKWVIGAFILGFIVFVTSLSSIPLVRILKSSIEQESQRRAMTIAKTITLSNREGIAKKVYSSLSVDFALKEPGVREAFIVDSLDGSLLAPVQKRGEISKTPFIHEARQIGKSDLKQINDSTIVAVDPILVYDAGKPQPTAKALSVVVYNMGALAVGDKRVVSLFIQTFFIAFLIGFILFFFLWKIIEKPFLSLNSQMDEALKSDDLMVSGNYKFPALSSLVENINNALNKIRYGQEGTEERVYEQDRSQEMNNIVQLVGFAAMTIRAGDFTVSALNVDLEEILGMTSADLLYKPIDQFPDQSLKLALKDLIDKSHQNPGEICSQALEFSGVNHEILLQPIYGSQDIAYYLLIIGPEEQEGDDE